MEKDISQFESAQDSKIRQCLVEEGYLFPLTDAEIESAMLELAKQNINIPPHLNNPLIYLNPPAHRQKTTAKVIPLSAQSNDEYVDNFIALAAREGAGDIPPEILEQMKKDRENQPDE